MDSEASQSARTSTLASVRVDRWLCASRCYKTRALAQQACVGGHVRVNDQAVKPSQPLRVGDEVQAETEGGRRVWQVLALAEKRGSAAAARQLYEDHSPPPPPKEERVAPRARGAGRPTKSDRRALRKLRGDY